MTKTVKYELLHHLNFLKSIGYDYHKSLDLISSGSQNTNLPNDLESLDSKVQHCYLCELSKSRKKPVFGEGNSNATVMFIGDSPSVAEDETGKVFSGRSGELLSKMIENVLKVNKEDVYVANIVKCRPNNRAVSNSEAQLCKSYLLKQIDIVKPKIIVTLGELSYQYLMEEETSLSKVRGQTIDFKNMQLIPTFHPTYLLRNPSSKKEAFVDMLKIKNIMENVN